MKPFPFELTQLSLLFRSLFSKIVWPSAQLLLTGAVLAVGTRTVTAVLRIIGHSEEQQFQKFHRVLNRVKWSPLAASRRLLMALAEAFVPQGPLVMALDDTIERRQGARIAAKGIYRDPVRSSHSHFVKASGLRWLCLMLIAPIPWAHRDWALPFCTALTPSERYYRERGRRPDKLTDRARQLLLMVKRWLPQRDIVIVADSSFAAIELLAAVSAQVYVITRLRLDAALYEQAPLRRANKVGRPRRKGARLPTLQTVLGNARTSWQTVTVTRWYSQGERNVEVASGTAVWYHTGKPVVPLRWVLVRDPQCRFKPQAFLCTDQTASPDQILNWFVKRWQVEVTFEEARAHLGMETQRQWSPRAIARTTPVILSLYSIIALLAKQRIREHPIILRHAAWYEKEAATFSDTIALVRRWFWCKQALSISEGPSETIELPRPLFDRLTETLSYAA